MIHLGVIGLGTIFPKQQIAFESMDKEYRLIAVCDKEQNKWKNCICRESDIRFYQKAEELLNNTFIDSVLIATPPATHYQLAKSCIEAGKHVLLEKPAVFSMEELEDLYQLAKKKEVIFQIAYHSSFGVDIIWYVNNKNEIEEIASLGKLTYIECGFYDPYIMDNQIIPQKISLGGSFMDSGVNALSVCNVLVDLQQVNKKKHEEHKQDGVTFSSFTEYVFLDGSIVIYTGWDAGKNEKTTLLGFSSSSTKLLLDHSNQRVVLLYPNGTQKELYRKDDTPRLVTHYQGVFRDFAKAVKEKKVNETGTLQIHRLLLAE